MSPRGVYDRAKATRRRVSTPQYRATSHDRPAPVAPVETAASEDTAPAPLTARIGKLVDGIRAAFVNFVEDHSALESSRADLAPRFMRAFEAWKVETSGTFAGFVRLLVPAVPASRDGYRAHPAYQAADYLRRLVQQGVRAEETPTERAERIQNAPVPPRRAAARILASVLPLLAPDALLVLRAAMADQLNWSEDQIEGFMTASTDETPLVRVRAPRGVHLDHALKVTVVHEAPRADESTPLTRTA